MSNYLSKVIIDNTEALIKDSILQESKPINILTLGAKNDGSADCSKIINTATKKYPLYFPAGTYRIDSPVTLYNSVYGVPFSRALTGAYTIFKSNIATANYIITIPADLKGKSTNFSGIEIVCNANNNGLNIATHTYTYIHDIAIYGFGNTGDGSWAGSNGYRYGIYIDISPYGQSRNLYCQNITIQSNANAPTIGISMKYALDCRFENLDIMFCRRSLDIYKSFIFLNKCHLWCGATDYSNVTANEFKSTRCIWCSESKIIGDSIYTDTAYVAYSISSSFLELTNIVNWFGIPDNTFTFSDCRIFDSENHNLSVSVVNGLFYIPNKYFGSSSVNNPDISLINCKFITDSDFTNYPITPATRCNNVQNKYYIYFYPEWNVNTYKCIAAAYHQNNYGCYTDMNIVVNDSSVFNIKLTNGGRTLNITKISGSDTSFYYKVINNYILIYSNTPSVSAFTNIEGRNTNFIDITQFYSESHKPQIISQADTTGLTAIKLGTDTTITF